MTRTMSETNASRIGGVAFAAVNMASLEIIAKPGAGDTALLMRKNAGVAP